MSKRSTTALNDSPHKRTRVEEEEDDEDEDVEMQVVLEDRDLGIVESITLKNFMCHSLLGPFTFGSNVNFVVGNNGSGKSAVLTALIVALGGKAQATNRGSSLKGFVKTGESSADVSITLRNKGRDAYRPEVYGNAITIDLRITREGVRTYKMKTKHGHIVSTKKDELVSILDTFNIQVNNPVSILTQEMSKHFLHSKGEEDKYRFFMKATQLEQMKEDYLYIRTTRQSTMDQLEKHGELLKDLKQKKQQKEDRYKSLASIDEMKASLTGLHNQMAWVLVVEMETEVQPMRDALQSGRQNTERYDKKVDEWEKKVEEAQSKSKQIHEQLDGRSIQIQDMQLQSAQLKAEAQRLDAILKSSEVTVHRCQTSLRDLEKDKDQLSSRINDLKLSISNTTGAESQARTKRMEQIQTELENMTHQTSTLDQQIGQYQSACSGANDELGKLRHEEHVLQRAIDSNRRNLQTMESSRSNRLRRFGEYMPAILTSIEDACKRNQFRQRPRGPLGHCISLKDPEMALAIEVCLKSLMLAFACDNYDDEKVLQGIMTRVCPRGRGRPIIITSSFLSRVHDTSRRAVNHPDYPSVLQSLEIEDPVVANCLIDQRGIESILLIKNNAEARRVMKSGNPPRNCSQAFSRDGDQIFDNRTYTSDQNRARYLSGDVEEEIRLLQRELENETAQAAKFQQQMRVVEDDIRRNEGLLKRTHTEQKNTTDKTRKLQLELTDLQNVEEPQSEDLCPLEEELQEINTRISSKRAEHHEARAEKATLQASYDEAEQEFKQHKQQLVTIMEESDSIKEEWTKADTDVAKCKHHKKHYEDKRQTHLSNFQTLEASLHSKEQDLTEYVAKATEICPERLEVRRTRKSLESEITRLKFKITTQQGNVGDPEQVIREYHEAVAAYKSMFQQISGMNTFIKTLDRIVTERHKVYNDFRRTLAARCKYYFNSMLNQRGYKGSMLFNHKKETLAISVSTEEASTEKVSDMRSLSGGERSFSTVCFVLALWHITEAPFRCLDEFDVYMDMVNRRVSMDMMLRVAAGQRHRQFIFLTPQSMSTLPESPNINILRMQDPDRGGSGPQAEEEED